MSTLNFADVNNSIQKEVKKCQTADYGPQRNVLCKFPFKYKNILRNECIADDDPEGKQWCATEVDANLEFSGINWGYCSNSCFETGTRFTYNEKERKLKNILCIISYHQKVSSYLNHLGK